MKPTIVQTKPSLRRRRELGVQHVQHLAAAAGLGAAAPDAESVGPATRQKLVVWNMKRNTLWGFSK